tara:strand:- start:2423 stop:3349 length:927 start_codon:yes stop_codon:yes gene_type:complete
MIKKLFYINLISIFFFLNGYSEENISIAVSINNKILTNLDINQEVSYLKILNPQLNKLEDNKIYIIAKNSLINETIKQKELIKFYKLDKELPIINNIFNDFFKSLGFSNEKEFEDILSDKNTYTSSEIKEKMKIEFFWNRIILEKYNDQVKINKNKLVQKIKNTKEFRIQYLLSEIFFNKEKNSSLEQQIEKINQSIIEVGFNNAASIFSKSKSANMGGKIGWVYEENLSQRIIEELKTIKIGEHTKAIKFSNNFLILKIEDKKNKKIETNEELLLKKMIEFEKNKQLNQFSKIYFNKIKLNYVIDEK